MNVQLFKGDDETPYSGADLKLLWRGIALDNYDGRRWTATTEIEKESDSGEKRVTDLTWRLQYDAKSDRWYAIELSNEGDNQYVRPFPMP